MLKKEWGGYRTYLSLVKLQPWLLSLRRKTCLWAELKHDDDKLKEKNSVLDRDLVVT